MQSNLQSTEGEIMKLYSNAGVVSGTFDEVLEMLQDQKYWVRFFANPCCPACDAENADRHIQDFCRQVDELAELDEGQKAALRAIAEERGGWYKSLPICKSF